MSLGKNAAYPAAELSKKENNDYGIHKTGQFRFNGFKNLHGMHGIWGRLQRPAQLDAG